MIITIDIGNTNTTVAVIREEKIKNHWRLSTNRFLTRDEIAIFLLNLLLVSEFDKSMIKGIIIASVVPELDTAYNDACLTYLGHKPIFINSKTDTGIKILIDKPEELGADRLVNAAAAFYHYKSGAIIIDSGTAITFDIVSDKGEYLGGVIAPGIRISVDALSRETSKLPRIKMSAPDAVIGKNTIQSIRSGIVYGYAGLIDGIVTRLLKTIDFSCKIIGTGGNIEYIKPVSSTIQTIDPLLTIKGLFQIYKHLS